LTIIAAIDDPTVIAKILTHLGNIAVGYDAAVNVHRVRPVYLGQAPGRIPLPAIRPCAPSKGCEGVF